MNSERFRELAERSGEMKSAIAMTNTEIQIMEATAVSAGEGMRVAFSNTGGALKRLDFQNASRGLVGFNKAMQSMDVNKMSKNFLGFSKVLVGQWCTQKCWEKHLFQLEFILANPIFL